MQSSCNRIVLATLIANAAACTAIATVSAVGALRCKRARCDRRGR